jgi:hypothetical protein
MKFGVCRTLIFQYSLYFTISHFAIMDHIHKVYYTHNLLFFNNVCKAQYCKQVEPFIRVSRPPVLNSYTGACFFHRFYLPESIEWFIEDWAFRRSNDMAPPCSLTPPVSKLGRRYTGRLRNRDNLLLGEKGRGVGKEPNYTTARNHGPL